MTRAAGDHRTQLSELTKNVRFDVADYATSLKVKIDDLTRDIAKQSSEVSQWKDQTNNRANFFKETVADFDVLRKTADGKTREFGDATATEMGDTMREFNDLLDVSSKELGLAYKTYAAEKLEGAPDWPAKQDPYRPYLYFDISG